MFHHSAAYRTRNKSKVFVIYTRPHVDSETMSYTART